jgi:hypothetical protein
VDGGTAAAIRPHIKLILLKKTLIMRAASRRAQCTYNPSLITP